MPRTHRGRGSPWKCPPDFIPHVVARYYCINKPIPSDFSSLGDKGQKSKDEAADPLTQEECQAGGALGIREGGELRFHQLPTLFLALKRGVGGCLAATGCGHLATLEHMNEGGSGALTRASYLAPTVCQRCGQVLYLCGLSQSSQQLWAGPIFQMRITGLEMEATSPKP